jgi:hypothetical protein
MGRCMRRSRAVEDEGGGWGEEYGGEEDNREPVEDVYVELMVLSCLYVN